jgi:hypothetical protein
VPVATLHTFDFSENETKLTYKAVKLFEPKKTKIYPLTTVTHSTVTTVKKGNFIDFTTVFPRDKMICFKPTSLISETGGSRMFGLHPSNPDVRIQCWMPLDKYTQSEAIALNSLEELSARVVGHSANSNTSSKIVFVTDLMESVPIQSVNGLLINDELLEKLPLKCSKCKEPLSESDVEDSYVKVHKTGSITMICPVCVEENLTRNPYWGGINQNVEASNSTVH